LALQVAQLFKVPQEISQDILEKWKPLKGRIEFIKKVKHVDYYNDTGSVSPEATLAALKSLSKEKNIILILGGSDAGKDYTELYKSLVQYVRALVLLPGSGTIKQRKSLHLIEAIEMFSAPSIPEAVQLAYGHAKEGDIVLFSPGFGALGSDASRSVRGEAFVRAVRGL
jgi:UDP-N-acetylmuramoylalanine--D-glutamate ligase